MSTVSARADLAVAYAERYNWKILPVWWVNVDGTCGCGSAHDGDNNLGKHPITATGLTAATSDVNTVRAWWTQWPEANVAVNCSESGLVVVDVDPRNGGDVTWEQVHEEFAFPETLRAKTGGGGWHYFYLASSLETFRGTLWKGSGVDIKHHGYVLLAPSNHVKGEYTWDSEGVAPQLLTGPGLEVLRKGGRLGANLSASLSEGTGLLDLAELFDGVPVGARHEAFKSYVGSLWARKIRYIEAKKLIEYAWAEADQSSHPFPLEEAIAILDWAEANIKPGTTAEQEYERNLEFVKGMGYEVHNGNAQLNQETANRLLSLPDGLRDVAINEYVRQEARAQVKRIREADAFRVPVSWRLDQLLSEGVPEPVWTIFGMHEEGTNSSLTAQFKTGKSTVQLNLIRALADNLPFLDEFPCRELSGNIAYFNYELTGGTLARWLTRMGIMHPERVWGLNLRDHRLDMGDDYTVEWVVNWLKEREIEFWIADPLARAYYGDENSNSELKLWTDRVDEIKGASGVTDFQVTLHTGRTETVQGEERARGATRIDDWVDARWILTMQGGIRFLRAIGREVEMDERMLMWDPESWRISVNHAMPVNRTVAASIQGVDHVLNVLRAMGTSSENPVLFSTLRDALTQGTNESKKQWIENAMYTGEIRWRADGRARLLWLEEGSGNAGI